MSATGSIKTKLVVLSLAGIMGMVVMLMVSLISERSNLVQDRKEGLRQTVETAHGVITHFQSLEQQGLMTTEAAKTAAKAAIGKLRYNGQDYFWINDMTPRMVMHPTKPEMNGQLLNDVKDPSGVAVFNEMTALVRQGGSGFLEYQWPRPGSDSAQPKLSYVKGFSTWGWVVGSGVYVDDINATFARRAIQSSLLVLVIGGATLFFALTVAKRILRPVRDLEQAMAHIAHTQDLTRKLEVNGNDEIARMGSAFNEMIGNFRTVVRKMTNSAEMVHQSVTALSRISTTVADSSAQQSKSALATSSAVSQMSSSIALVADHAKNTDSTALEAESLSSTGASVVTQAVQDMNQIADSVQRSSAFISTLGQQSEQISSIVQVIKDISDQTNLLALNAAIEAARAGEQGRGFAVVADEVRKLAERTGKATEEISAKIQCIQVETQQAITSMEEGVQRVRGGVETAEQARDSMEKIRQGADLVRSSVRDISQALQEQNAASALMAENIVHISHSASKNSNQVREMADNAEVLQQLANELRSTAKLFHA